MSVVRRWLTAAALCTLAVSADAQSAKTVVVVLSFDGFAAAYLDHEQLPNFARLIARGTRADALIPAFPSKTFPNHYTMATGLYPGHHGIVASNFYDPVRHASFRGSSSVGDGSWFGGEPIWVTAERQGLHAATYFWPGSEAAIEGVRPTFYRIYDPNIADSTKVDQIAAWLRLPDAQRPRLVMAYFPEVDTAGHYHGPQSTQVHDASLIADRALGRMLDSLDARAGDLSIEVVVVSDHGMASVTPDHVVYLDELTHFDSVLLKNDRATASVWSEGNFARLDSIYETLRRTLTHAHVYRLADLPPRWHTDDNPRFGDLLIVADAGYDLAIHHPPTQINPGEHGYDPADPSMRGIFIAAGPRFPAHQRIPAIENVIIYPLIAELLGITPASHLDVSPRALDVIHMGAAR